MSAHDLDRLDERAAAAASDVRRRAGDRPRPTFDPRAAATPEALAPATALRGRGRSPQVLAAAAAIVAVLLGAALWASGRDGADEDPTDVVTTEVRPYRATELPEGLVLAGAGEVDASAAAEAAQASSFGPLELYGPSLDEPGLGASWFGDDEVGVDAGEVVAERDGREVRRLATDGALPPAVAIADPRRGWIVLVSPTLADDELAAVALAASSADGRVTIPSDALPDGWRPLGADARGLLGILPTVLRGDTTAAVRATYYASADAGEITGATEGQGSAGDAEGEAPEPQLPSDLRSITITASPGDEVAVAAARLRVPEVTDLQVRGHVAVASSVALDGSGPAFRSLTWLERPGEVLTVTGVGLELDELRSVAESIEPIPAGEWRDLIARSQLGDLPGSGSEQGVELARGQFDDGTVWILRDTAEEGQAPSIDLQVALAGDSSSSSSGSSSSVSGAPDGPPLRSLEVEEISDRRFAAGLVDPRVVRVEVRAADGTVLAEAPATAGTDGRADGWFVLEVPADGTELVLLDEAGVVLGATGLADVEGGDPTIDGGRTPTSVEVAPLPTAETTPVAD